MPRNMNDHELSPVITDHLAPSGGEHMMPCLRADTRASDPCRAVAHANKDAGRVESLRQCRIAFRLRRGELELRDAVIGEHRRPVIRPIVGPRARIALANLVT